MGWISCIFGKGMFKWVDFVEQLVKNGPNLYRGTIVLHIEGFCRENNQRGG